MGKNFSLSVTQSAQCNVVGISLRHHKIRLIHAPEDVQKMVREAVLALYTIIGTKPTTLETRKWGTTQLRAPQKLFAQKVNDLQHYLGMKLMVAVLEGMEQLDYDFIACTDVGESQLSDRSTLFFRPKTDTIELGRPASPAVSELNKERLAAPELMKESSSIQQSYGDVVCISPWGKQYVTIFNASDAFVNAVTSTMNTSECHRVNAKEKWIERVYSDKLTHIRMKGEPWAEHHEVYRVGTGEWILALVNRLASMNYKLLGGINVFGATDTMFFLHTEKCHDDEYRMVSLDSDDSIHLLPQDLPLARSMMDTFAPCGYQFRRGECDAKQLRFSTTPWRQEFNAAVASYRLFGLICTQMLEHGWVFTQSLNLNRLKADKGKCLFRRAEPIHAPPKAIIAFCGQRTIKLVDFPPAVAQSLYASFQANYSPGIRERSKLCAVDNKYSPKPRGAIVTITLCGNPWSGNTAHGIHSRSALIKAIAQCERLGWHLLESMNATSRGKDHDAWYLIQTEDKKET